jgi:branched-subunit amino acid transport protein
MQTIWLTLAAAGLLTYLTRLSFMGLLQHWQMPDMLRRALRFVPPAVLSAIIFPDLLLREGVLAFSLDNYRLLAGVAAALVGWRTRNILWTIASGMAVLYLLQWLSVSL